MDDGVGEHEGDGGTVDAPPSPAAPTGRAVGAFVLLALGVVAVALAVPTFWVPNGLLRADGLADAAGPLAQDVPFRGYLAGSLTARLSVAYDSPSGRAANRLDDAVRAELQRPGFEVDWRRDVARSQPQLREALIGQQPQVGPDDGKVFVDLRPTAERIIAALRDDPRFAAAPTLDADQFRVSLLNLRSFEGARSPARSAVDLRWLWLAVAVAGVGGGLALARRRWRATAVTAAVVVVALAAQLPILAAGRSAYLDELKATSVPRPAAGQLIDALTSSLRDRLVIGAAVAFVVAVVAVAASVVGSRRAPQGRGPA